MPTLGQLWTFSAPYVDLLQGSVVTNLASVSGALVKLWWLQVGA